jgi:hypothetical protein
MGRCGCCNTGKYEVFVQFIPYVAASYAIEAPHLPIDPNDPFGNKGCHPEFKIIDEYFYNLSLAGCGYNPPLPKIQDFIDIPSCIIESKKNKLKRNYDKNKLYVSPIIENFNLYINDNLELSDQFSYLLPRQTNYNNYNPGKSKYNYWRGFQTSAVYSYNAGIINPEDQKLYGSSSVLNGYKGFNYTGLGALCTISLGQLKKQCQVKADINFYNTPDVYTEYGFANCGDGALLKGSYVINEGIIYDINSYVSQIELPPSVGSISIIYPIIITYSGNKGNLTGSNSGQAKYKTNIRTLAVNDQRSRMQSQLPSVVEQIKTVGNIEVSVDAKAQVSFCKDSEIYNKYPYEQPNPCDNLILPDQFLCGRHVASSSPKRLVVGMTPKFTFGSAFVRLKYIKFNDFTVQTMIIPIIPLSSEYLGAYTWASIEATAWLKGSISKNNDDYIYNNDFQIKICDNNIDVTSASGDVLIEYSGYKHPVISDSVTLTPQGIFANAAIKSSVCSSEFTFEEAPPKTIGIYYRISGFNGGSVGGLYDSIEKTYNTACQDPAPAKKSNDYSGFNTRLYYQTYMNKGEGAGAPTNSKTVGLELVIDGQIFPMDSIGNVSYYISDFTAILVYVDQEIE